MLKSDAIPSRMLYLQPEIPGSCIKIRIRKPLFKADSLSASKSLGDDKEFLCSETFQECSVTEISAQNFEEHDKLTFSESNDGNVEETNFNLESSFSKFIEKEQNNCCQENHHSETSLNNEQSDLILELADFYSNFCMQVEEKETLTIYPSDDLSRSDGSSVVIIDTTSNTN